jgi:hypothetical protein
MLAVFLVQLRQLCNHWHCSCQHAAPDGAAHFDVSLLPEQSPDCMFCIVIIESNASALRAGRYAVPAAAPGGAAHFGVSLPQEQS